MRYRVRVARLVAEQRQVVAFLRARGQACLFAIERQLMTPYTCLDLAPWPAIRSWHARIEAREDFVPLPGL